MKKMIAIVAGGDSSEHDVSLRSAAGILSFMDSQKYDVYVVEIKGNNKYGTPENLGSTINTAGRESFPFITKDNVLYYSSDGFPGLGGLDIFAVKFFDDGTTSKPINVGK